MESQDAPPIQLFKSYYYFSETARWKGHMRENVHYLHEKGFSPIQIAEILLVPPIKVARSINAANKPPPKPRPKRPKRIRKTKPKPYMPLNWRDRRG